MVSPVERRWEAGGRRLIVVTLYLLLDGAVLFLSALLSGWAVFGMPPSSPFWRWSVDKAHGPLLFVSPAHARFSFLLFTFIVYFLFNHGFYETKRGVRYSQEFLGVLRAVSLASVLAVTANFFFHGLACSRAVIGIQAALTIGGLFTWRYIKRKYVELRVMRGYRRMRSLIIGAGKMGQYLRMILEGRSWLGVDVLGFLDDRYGEEENGTGDILGRIGDFERVVRENGIEEVYVTIPSERKVISELVEMASTLGVAVKVVPEMYDMIFREVKFENVGSLPVMRLSVPALRPGQALAKRVLELAITIPLLLLVLPFMAVIAAAIVFDSRGPVFFKQRILGMGGKSLTIYKFRSMFSGADERPHKEYLERLIVHGLPADENGEIFKLAQDPRVTRVGRILRKYSLDELPQLWNVIRGDLYLIGPRPPVFHEYVHYNDYHKKRLLIKPGITGLWQVSGKSRLSFEKMVMLDILYINDWSIWLDLKIALDTIPVILRGQNL